MTLTSGTLKLIGTSHASGNSIAYEIEGADWSGPGAGYSLADAIANADPSIGGANSIRDFASYTYLRGEIWGDDQAASLSNIELHFIGLPTAVGEPWTFPTSSGQMVAVADRNDESIWITKDGGGSILTADDIRIDIFRRAKSNTGDTGWGSAVQVYDPYNSNTYPADFDTYDYKVIVSDTV